MTVKELIKELETFNQEMKVKIPSDKLWLGDIKTVTSRNGVFVELLPMEGD